MECLSCSTEINPKWAHAINQNICPFCGEEIMPEDLKQKINALSVAMSEMLEYQKELNDWMLSNHNYIKTDDDNLVKFVPKELLRSYHQGGTSKEVIQEGNKYTVKVTHDDGTEEDVDSFKLASEEKAAEFAKRAGVRPSKLNKLKDMVKNIQNTGGGMSDMSGMMDLPPGMLANADPDAIADYQNILDGDSPFAGGPVNDASEFDPPGFAEVMAHNTGMTQSKNGGHNAKDLALSEKMRAKAQRSGFGGGFSRNS